MQIRFFCIFGLYLHFYAFLVSFCIICILGFTLPFDKNLALLTSATLYFVKVAVKKKRWTRSLALGNSLRLGQCLVGKRYRAWRRDPTVIANFLWCPWTVRGAFSSFKDLFSSKKNCLTEAHLKDQMLIHWNWDLLLMNAVSGLINHLKCKNL